MKTNNSWHDKLYDANSAKFSIDSPRFKKLAANDVKAIISLVGLKKMQKFLMCHAEPAGT